MVQKIVVNQETCIGCGACAATCPKGFEMKDGKAVVKSEDAPCVKDAIAGCPVQAISVS